MITLHILQLLANDNFGVIDTSLFWNKLPLKKYGIAIFDRGAPVARGTRLTQSFDLYSRGKSDLLGADKLEKILEYMQDNYVVCDLPIVPEKSVKQYKNCQIVATSNVENLGLDENDRLVFRLSGQISYQRQRS